MCPSFGTESKQVVTSRKQPRTQQLLPIGWKNSQIVRQLQREMTNAKPSSLCETPSSSRSDFIIGQL
jgi:hypothetical protein